MTNVSLMQKQAVGWMPEMGKRKDLLVHLEKKVSCAVDAERCCVRLLETLEMSRRNAQQAYEAAC